MRRWDRETALVAGLAACVSVVSFLFYFHHDAVLLYGDAVAHINIARRVFDSRTPGLLQLGTVWLPLPHLLMIPFLLSDRLWRTGVGGSIPSLAGYVLGALGIFRLVRGALSFHAQVDLAARIAAWMAVGIYAANPNLIYLQTTAMTEPVYLALFIWAVVYFSEFAQTAVTEDSQDSSLLLKCGLCLTAACLTRYDAWFLSAATCGLAALIVLKDRHAKPSLRRGFRRFVLLAAAAPVLWLGYNAIVYRNPLEFANGPYSAQAIEKKTSHLGVSPHPGSHDLLVAASYFLKSAELNLAEGNWQQRIWVVLLLAGVLLSCVVDSRLRPPLLLLIPVPFYVLSIAHGGVPIFLPVWWPFSFYNVRYGLELLPAFAVFVAVAAYFVADWVGNAAGRMAVAAPVVILVAGSYASVWRAQPVCFREAWINSRTRIALESELAAKLAELPPASGILMYLGDHVGALQRAGTPLRRVICEGNHRSWKQPADPEGLWERALADPARYADFVVAAQGDPVFTAVPSQTLFPVAEIDVPGQPRTNIYRTHPPAR